MLTLGKIIYSTISSKEKIELRQLRIRATEWNAISDYILNYSKFLDVGCGAGYAMQQAREKLNCICTGIDPDPGAHGVGRFLKELVPGETIIQGHAENLPFKDEQFDVVFSSHVLEHVENERVTLEEMKRVLKNDGVLIIGIPTASMAWINLFSQVFFTTHIKVYEFFRFLHQSGRTKRFTSIFRVISHSQPRATSIWYDITHYRVKNWKKTVSKEFEIITTLEPFLYPYPDYPQWFKPHVSKLGSSSVFFICKKAQNFQ
jgi:ubiquinone/menaquinone biosynthesis C-methylase UbiE